MRLRFHFDGAVSESRLGCDIGIGVAVFVDDVFHEDLSIAKFFKGNEESSSNVAEWLGCVEAFKLIREYKGEGDEIEVFSDSQIISRQFNGEYQIKKEGFRKYYNEARRYYFLAGLGGLKIQWVRREFNKEADRLSKLGLKSVN